MRLQISPHLAEIFKVPVRLRLKSFLDLPHCIGNVADDLVVRKVDLVHLRAGKVDVDHARRAAAAHHERRLFDDVMADVDDDVSGLDGAVEVVLGGEGGGADEERVRFVDDAFAHLRVDEGDAQLVDQLAEHFLRELAVGAVADEHEGVAGLADHVDSDADA